MKKLSKGLLGIVLSINGICLYAQDNGEKKLYELSSYELEICNTKTSNIIFPYAIVSVDRGSQEILAQKASGVENILQLKAAKANFTTSNVSVVTADGKLNTFVVKFAANPTSINLSLQGTGSVSSSSVFIPKEEFNESEVRECSNKLLANRNYVRGRQKEAFGIAFNLRELFIRNNVIYFQFKITNYTNVGYDIDQLRFYIRDQKRAVRTATQELEVLPIFVSKSPEGIPGKTRDMFVFALPKFTIPDQKDLVIQLMEKNGGRHLQMKVSNRELLKAKPFK
ncbi:conjugative transposon protein TraN [Pedobacter xixiisoli]|uniref:Bacteroides conjugative transposon TraN protein n=1 Tax=Pedobacter xixiisoli TaxID=1476464 RepID=A0A286A6V6_9SPHI|nr:conjugative transposon protein TraN [Pedobacter xixiisoli]SOD17663.1 Bacteroides conjugative transposon TraN protein [Pedobacter xixiisoli]